MRFALVLCCSVALLGSVGTVSAQDWTKSKWGPNDEIGAGVEGDLGRSCDRAPDSRHLDR